ncbi:Receptor-interacting serine/threonine-protein kinase 3 [Pleodorina starrii]|uniref:Receptor-interacting serine/threonine-protein kinase 3 n=1 Tax=Pleodorina starrii TaxID=330485 RepID=A0A9W6EWV1_9CHLO|nr:Receptor-interacting serine/threonine-protein kinase 3 [Pleodorina starrii]GLC47670.1 Receptor-interacting serine/threonine-protein kinase 3 [Pleodorina starrii]GLC70919.1 Receptor-interacting serine/threonine-protein kinase 3 [Pleodorina starrii]
MVLFCCFPGGGPAAARQAQQEPEFQHEEQVPQAQQPVQAEAAAVGPQPVPDGSSQPASFSRGSLPTQLSQLLSGVPAAGARSNDLWANLAKSADSLVAALAITAASFYIFTSSRRFCKVVPSTSSPLSTAVRKSGWELCHAAETPSAVQVATSRTPTYFQVPRASPASHSRGVPADFHVLHQQAGCQAFLMLPLYQGHTVVGALLLAHTEPIPTLAEHRWLAAYLPLLSLYLTETSALKLVNFTEKIQTAVGLNQLAWIISSELDSWFDWCHPDDTEARLVLLAPDQSAAMVLSRSVGALRAFDPVNSIDVLVSGGMRSGSTYNTRRTSANIEPELGPLGLRRDPSFASRGLVRTNTGGLASSITGGKTAPEEGLLGTHMSLSNTLTRRCLAEGSKLLFVADVMAALKKYGEPWKDVFMEQARVTNPTWVVAAPIAHAGKHLGAILWLSSSRLNPNMLAQTAKATVPLLLHTVARQMVHLIQQASSAAGAVDDPGVFWSQLLAMPHLNMLSGATATGFANGGTGAGYTGTGLDTVDVASSLGGSVIGAPGVGVGVGMPARAVSGHSDALTGGGILTGVPTDGSRQLRYTVMVRSDSVSTSALVRAYQTAIAHAQRSAAATVCAEVGSAYEEIQVIAKAGQGAFGSVYVALWKGLVVAVKVMRQQAEGRRAMRTAWELAVTKSVSHPNIVMVYATFTDVVVVKLSKRLIRFVPAATTLADPAVPGSASSTGVAGAAQGGGGAADGGQAAASDAGARCQVIIMEYCNLGPLHHYVAERRYAQQLAQQQAERDRQQQQQAGGGGGAAGAVSGPAPSTAPGSGDAAPESAAAAAGGAGGEGWCPAASGAASGPAVVATNGGGTCGGLGASGSNSSSGCLPAGAVTGPVEFSTTLATLLEVASALQYLHSLGFIHCDLKPENVLLKASPGDPRGFTIKVSDFGLSELLTSDGPLMGELGGTVTHIAPEIVTHKRVTKAADAYAFGVVMWEMLTGSRLYSDLFTSGREKRVRDKLILAKVAHEGLRPVFPEGTPHEYALLARRCWTADPTLRPTFTEILAELELIQRRYCKNVQSALPGLEGIMGAAGAPATAAAATPPPAAAPAAQGAAGGAGSGGGGVCSPDAAAATGSGGVAPAGGNTAPLPQAQRALGSAPQIRATTDVGMASMSPRGHPGGSTGSGGAAAASGQAGTAMAPPPPSPAPQAHLQAAPNGAAAPSQQALGGGAAAAAGAPAPGGVALRAVSTHSPLSPSPLRQMSNAREETGGNGTVAAPSPPATPGAVAVAAGAATGGSGGGGVSDAVAVDVDEVVPVEVEANGVAGG